MMAKRMGTALVMLLVIAAAVFAGCAQNKTEEAKDKVGIIGAMEVELNDLKKNAEIEKTTEIDGMEFCEGQMDNMDVVIVKCGMGKVNAGACASTLINDFG